MGNGCGALTNSVPLDSLSIKVRKIGDSMVVRIPGTGDISGNIASNLWERTNDKTSLCLPGVDFSNVRFLISF